MEATVLNKGIILSLETQSQALLEYSPVDSTTAETRQVSFSKIYYGELPAPAHLIKAGVLVDVETVGQLVVRVIICQAKEAIELLGTIIDSNSRLTSVSYALQGITVEEIDTKLLKGTDGLPVAGSPNIKGKFVRLLVSHQKIISATLVNAVTEVVEGRRYELAVTPSQPNPPSSRAPQIVPSSTTVFKGIIARLTSRVNIEIIEEGAPKNKLRLAYSEVMYANGRVVDQNDFTKGEHCLISFEGDSPTVKLLRNRRFCQDLADFQGLPESLTRNFLSLFLNRDLPVVFYYALLETIIRLDSRELVNRIFRFSTDTTLRSLAQKAISLSGEQHFNWYELEEEVLDHAEHIHNFFAEHLRRTKQRQKLVNSLHIAVEFIDMVSLDSIITVPAIPGDHPPPFIRIAESDGFHYVMYLPEMLEADGIDLQTFLPTKARKLPAIQYPFYYASSTPRSAGAQPPAEASMLCCHGQHAKVCANHCFSCVKCFGTIFAQRQCWCGTPLDLQAVNWDGFRAPCDACKVFTPGTQPAFLECGCVLCVNCYSRALQTLKCLYCLEPLSAGSQQLNQRLVRPI